MVSFICDACGQTVKKNRVEKHYQSECRNCCVLSCIDCGKDFHGDAYAEHTSCISEAEKYQGKLYKPKEKGNKGDVKQQEWMKAVQEASRSDVNPRIKGYLNQVKEYSNVPRKKGKFINFCKNSLRLHDLKILEQLWDAFNPKKSTEENGEAETTETTPVANGNGLDENSVKHSKKSNHDSKEKEELKVESKDKKKSKKRKAESEMENGNCEKETKDDKQNGKKKKKRKTEDDKIIEKEESSDEKATGKFSWQKAIKSVLKDAGEDGILLKKLQKKVISAYNAHGTNHQATTKNECAVMFKRKLDGYPKAVTKKERVYFSKK